MIKNEEIQEYLAFAKRIIKEAGKISLKYFQKEVSTSIKADKSPVTEADIKTEEFLEKEILNRYPGHSILAEEGGAKGNPDSKFKWIIDPIDGTKAFLCGVPLYTNLLALMHEDEVLLGSIYCPPQDMLCYAALNSGCFLNDKRCKTSNKTSLESSIFCFTDMGANFRRGYKDLMIKFVESASQSRGWGDGYGYMMLASGKIDIMVDPHMALWDVAPMKVIVEEAGGYFTDVTGKDTKIKDSSISCANKELFLNIKEKVLG